MKKISRFEIITPSGRYLVKYMDAKYDIQDDGRTLKIFTSEELDKSIDQEVVSNDKPTQAQLNKIKNANSKDKAWEAYEAIEKQAREAYEAVENPAREAYQAVENPAEEEYEAVENPAREAYEAIEKQAREAYEAVENPAREAYQAVEKQAREAYQAIKNQAHKVYENWTEPKEKESNNG